MAQYSLASLYPLNTGSIAELTRLTRQDRVFTSATGLLPWDLELRGGQHVLDLRCGTGEWVLTLAKQYSDIEITGVDLSSILVEYAQSLAIEESLSHAHFQVTTMNRRLAFPDASIDLIHARMLSGFLSPELWPKLFAECYRLLKPGGVLIGVESNDMGSSTSPSLTRLISLSMSALRQTGHCFTPAGEHTGVALVYPRLLAQAGFSNIQREAFILDYSAGTASHSDMLHDWATLFQLGGAFLAHMNGLSEAEIATLRNRAIAEMNAPDFCALAFLQRVWAYKPEECA
ncbi:class I SAM-dependent methyltransferase [Ktedonosporobacter rubrisoli]|uniref:Class I SAM-dependent methyltransferase n=1 Tax=Ktedonosporobacter rubrisoli TaxID=2509675 RepID=A0A4P6JVX6_KTERU|nr:class I SAM-dependent methyltransferase [Ktedonosporobacter rubrisoli]QBD79510.1 class I SAM-dependent methyltransferase [Ktedonosporobacter rubrisoli]